MTCKNCLYYPKCEWHIDEETTMTVNECKDFKDKSRFHFAKYDLGEMVWYGDKFNLKQGEIIQICFDGTFNNIPKYEIEYNGNYWAEDDVFSTREEAEKALKERENK